MMASPVYDPIDRHNEEICRNRENWCKKPLLQMVYGDFYRLIDSQLNHDATGPVVELGSGIGAISEFIPDCIRTDLFPNPWIDRVENAYRLSFVDESVGNLILFDIFHHLRYPGTALCELHRVLAVGGRVIVFEPCISLLGLLVYGLGHEEPLRLGQRIEYYAPDGWTPEQDTYYAAQGNACRFFNRTFETDFPQWRIVHKQRLAAFSYVLSGGYSRRQLYPDRWYPLMKKIDSLGSLAPWFTATRLMIVLEKIIK